MRKYKSVKTSERLQKITTPNPYFELSDTKEIDAKFNSLIKQSEQETLHNSTVAFGHVAIQTAVQGLILHTISEEDDQEVSKLTSNILKTFNINVVHLTQLKNREEKHKYLIDQLNETINGLLKTWSDKLFLKEQKYKEVDEIQKKEKQSAQQKKHFKWLKLKTKYDQLKAKLRQIVIDKLNDYENSQQIMKSKGVLLKNVNIITTRNIFENMEKFGKSNEFHFLKSLSQDRLKRIRDQMNQSKQKTINSSKQTVQQQQEQDHYLVDWNESEEGRFLNQRGKTKQLFSNEVSSSSWNYLGFVPILQQLAMQEKKKQQRDNIMDRYIEGDILTTQELQFLANTSDLLNACLDKDFFQKAANRIDYNLLQNMELSLAEQILFNYEEMKQATMKARLLFIQAKIQKTKQKLMEREIKMRKVAQEQYNMELNRKYIKVCTTVVRHMERTGKFEEKYPDDLPCANHLNEYLNGRIDERQFIIKLKDYAFEKEKKRRSRYEQAINFESFQKERAASSLHKSQSDQQTQQTNSKFKRAEYFKEMSRPKSTVGFQFVTNIKRHIYHPATKVLINKKLDDDDDIEMAYINPIRMQYNKSEQEKFKLSLKSHPALKLPQNFKKFYSGGPPLVEDRQLLKNNEPTQKEINAAIVIQRKLRSLFREKRLRQKLEDRRKQIYYLFKDNCETLVSQAQMDRQDQQVLNYIITKQLEKCKDVAKDTINFGKLKTEENKKLKSKPSMFSTDVSTPKHPTLQTLKFPNTSNRVKMDLLFQAVQKNRIMMVLQSHFVYAASDLSCQNHDGDTPLHISVRNSNQDLTEWLLKNEADPYILNLMNQSPMDIAQIKNKANILRLFKQYCSF